MLVPSHDLNVFFKSSCENKVSFPLTYMENKINLHMFLHRKNMIFTTVCVKLYIVAMVLDLV